MIHNEKARFQCRMVPGSMRGDKPRNSLFSTLVLVVGSFIALVITTLSFVSIEYNSQHFSTPTPPPKEICGHVMARPSWHDLPLHRRHAYTRAVQRLTTLPSRLGLNTSLYDDFTYVHLQLVWQVHHTAISLPFHRYFIHVFEQALRKEGAFDDPLPYWDWTLDAENPLQSPIWDRWAGFGGNGSATGCVEDGVFARIGKLANYSEHGYQPHCVQRLFAIDTGNGTMQSLKWNRDAVKAVIEEAHTYDQFRTRLESGPHKYLHRGIGGEMPTGSSTNDPIFFLHHAQIDRLWWLWQQTRPDQGRIEFFGPVQLNDETRLESGATLEDRIQLLGLAVDVNVRDVMRTDVDMLCYKYKQEF